jgi:hypothetical protein
VGWQDSNLRHTAPEPFELICDSEKCPFLYGFCVITFVSYHDKRLSYTVR